MSGMMSVTAAGMWCAIATTAAIAQRHVTGEGQRVEASLLAALVDLLTSSCSGSPCGLGRAVEDA